MLGPEKPTNLPTFKIGPFFRQNNVFSLLFSGHDSPLQLLDSTTKKRVMESYHSLDSAFCREILGRKLNSKLRKDLDEVADKTGILIRSCRRQFDNIKKVFKAVEDVAPRNYVSTISSTFGLSKTLAEKYAALVFAASFRLELVSIIFFYVKLFFNGIHFFPWNQFTFFNGKFEFHFSVKITLPLHTHCSGH